MTDKMMYCGPIHRLPEDLWLAGLIALDKETGLYTFHWAIVIPDLQQYKQTLIRAGVKEEEITLFEGLKKDLIAIIKPLNDAIRAKNKMPNLHPALLEKLLPSATA